jgi:hypothetical protein
MVGIRFRKLDDDFDGGYLPLVIFSRSRNFIKKDIRSTS